MSLGKYFFIKMQASDNKIIDTINLVDIIDLIVRDN